MIQIILILVVLKYLLNYIWKPKNNILCCGIFGQATNSPKKINESNIKILGMFNESRGKSSCGITYDGDLHHGLDKDKLFTDFIKGRSFKPKSYPVVFGHTRQSSVGAINEFNCHPFGFGTNRIGDGYKFIMCHNGTLLNYKELATQYEVSDTEKYRNVNDYEITRTKIDSEILGEVLYKSKSLKVLSEYNGRAALVWTDTDSPNIVYLWSGKSRPRIDDDATTAEEERPLNVWIESKNNFYFSSLSEALQAISGNSKNIFQIEYNTVYVVKDGNFADAKKIPISRRKNFHIETYGSNGSFGRSNQHINAYAHGHSATSGFPQRNRAFSELGKDDKDLIKLPLPVLQNIYDDKQLKAQNDYKGRAYPAKLRFWQNGHPIQGIYIYIPDHGYYLVGEDNLSANMNLMKYVGVPFVDGEFDLSRKSKLGEGKVIYTNMNSSPKLYYFVEGVPMEYPADYVRCLEIKKSLSKGVYMDYNTLSHGSLIPVVQIDWSMKSLTTQGIIKEGQNYTGAVDFLGFEKIYTINNGNLSGVAKKITDQVIVRNPNSGGAAFPGTNSRVKSQEEAPSSTGEYNPARLEKAYDNICNLENRITELELEEEINSTVNPTLEDNTYMISAKDITGENDDVYVSGKSIEEYIAENNPNTEIMKQDDEKFLDSLNQEDQSDSDNEIEEQVQCIINERLFEPLKAFQETKKDLVQHLPHPAAKEAIKMIDDMTKLLETFIIKS